MSILFEVLCFEVAMLRQLGLYPKFSTLAIYHPRCTKGTSETKRTHTQTSKEVCAVFLLQTVTPAPCLSSLPWETDAKLSPI